MSDATRSPELRQVRGPSPTYETGPAASPHRLLLISWHFPPDQAVGALRWQKLARYAAERGWGLDVITLADADFEARDLNRLHDLPQGVRTYGVALPRLRVESLGDALWRASRRFGWLLSRAGNGAVPPVAAQGRRASLGRAEIRWWPREGRDIARAYFAWLGYVRAGRWARLAVRRALEIIEPGVHRAVISCGPPEMAYEAGRLVAQATTLPFIMDLRDPWSHLQRLPEAIASPVWLWFAARSERRAVAQAALIIANTEPLRNALRRAYPEAANRTIAVPNGYDEDSIPPQRHGCRFTIGYAGSIYLDRDPRALFRAVARVVTELGLKPGDCAIELMGSVATFNGVELETIAAEEGVEAYLRVRPAGTRAEALRFLSRAALLVILPQDSDMAIPAKLFDYMLFDAWVLALAERGSATEVLLRGSGADVVAPSAVDAIAQVLRRRYGEYARGERAVRLATHERYSRRAQARVLFEAVEAITGAAGRSPAPCAPAGSRR
jgi:glycosyltransferase involved in cell wall biosynthesis